MVFSCGAIQLWPWLVPSCWSCLYLSAHLPLKDWFWAGFWGAIRSCLANQEGMDQQQYFAVWVYISKILALVNTTKAYRATACHWLQLNREWSKGVWELSSVGLSPLFQKPPWILSSMEMLWKKTPLKRRGSCFKQLYEKDIYLGANSMCTGLEYPRQQFSNNFVVTPLPGSDTQKTLCLCGLCFQFPFPLYSPHTSFFQQFLPSCCQHLSILWMLSCHPFPRVIIQLISSLPTFATSAHSQNNKKCSQLS